MNGMGMSMLIPGTLRVAGLQVFERHWKPPIGGRHLAPLALRGMQQRGLYN